MGRAGRPNPGARVERRPRHTWFRSPEGRRQHRSCSEPDRASRTCRYRVSKRRISRGQFPGSRARLVWKSGRLTHRSGSGVGGTHVDASPARSARSAGGAARRRGHDDDAQSRLGRALEREPSIFLQNHKADIAPSYTHPESARIFPLADGRLKRESDPLAAFHGDRSRPASVRSIQTVTTTPRPGLVPVTAPPWSRSRSRKQSLDVGLRRYESRHARTARAELL